MKRFRLGLAVLTMFALLQLSAGSVLAQTGQDVPEMRAIDEAVLAFIEKWNIPGASVAMSYRGRLVYARGFGMADLASNTPVEPHHVFRLASISKSITGIAFAKLMEEGKVSERDKVFGEGGHLEGDTYGTLNDERMMDITVGDLLHHTSGMSRLSNNFDPVFADHYMKGQTGWELPHTDVQKLQYYLSTQTLARAPGSAYEYANIGYLTLGRILEKITGMEYEEYVKSEIAAPLGISTLRQGKSLKENTYDNEVTYYNYEGAPNGTSVQGDGQSRPWPYGPFRMESFDALGGWTASATDLVRLLVAVDGFTTKPDILTAQSLNQMSSTTTAAPRYGFGWNVNTANNWWHFGGLPGTATMWLRGNGQINWAILFNRRPSENNFYSDFDAFMWQALPGVTTWPTHDFFVEPTSTEDLSFVDAFDVEVYPNPSTFASTITLNQPNASTLKIELVDVLGRTKNIIHDGTLTPGRHNFNLNTNKLAAGLYAIRVTGANIMESTMFTVVR